MLNLNSIPSPLDVSDTSATPSGHASQVSPRSLPHTATFGATPAMPPSQQGDANTEHAEPERFAASWQALHSVEASLPVEPKDQTEGIALLQGPQTVQQMPSTVDTSAVPTPSQQQTLTAIAVDSQQQPEAVTAANEGGQVLESPEQASGLKSVQAPALASRALPSRPSRAFSVGSPSEAGVVNAAQGRERSEAARRGTRNSLLSSLHRVAIAELAEFQDLPIDGLTHPGNIDVLAAMDVL